MAEVALTWNSIAIPPSSFLSDEIRSLIAEDRYEKEETSGALEVITHEDRVVEMGAGLGVVGATIGVHCQPELFISFEGNPQLIPHIKEIYELNNLSQSHQINNMLLVSKHDTPTKVPFHLHKSFLGSSTMKSEKYTDRTIFISTRQFSDLCKEIKPTALVMDIEGGEDVFLKYANLDGIRKIIIEFHREHYARAGVLRCKWRLLRAGFRPLKSVSTSTVWTCIR